jgi:hypothetical protein
MLTETQISKGCARKGSSYQIKSTGSMVNTAIFSCGKALQWKGVKRKGGGNDDCEA